MTMINVFNIYNNLKINGKLVKDLGSYTVKHDYYFFIGDDFYQLHR